MTVVDVLQLSFDTYLALSFALATLWLYSASSPFSLDAKTIKDRVLSTLLLAHTLYMLHALLVSPPQNIFKSLRLPPNVPSEYLHAKLVETYGGESNIPSSLAALPKRLGLMELRALYIRLGHEVIASCFYCQSSDDYTLYAFPTPLSEYIREIAFIGLLTLPRSLTSYLRPLGLGVLLASLLAEIYWTLTVQVTIPPFGNDTPVTMWHDTFVQLRHALFLILPLLISILPHLGLHRIPILGTFVPTPAGYTLPPNFQGHGFSIPANVTFNQMSTMTLQTLGHLLPTLHLLKFTHGAVMRSQTENSSFSAFSSSSSDSTEFAANHENGRRSARSSPSPHALATEWWADESREGHAIRTNKEVLHLLKEDGLTSEAPSDEGRIAELPEGHLLLSARMAVKMLKEQGARPSDHWAYGDSG